MRVDLVLRQLLTATAEKTAAERRIARYRDRLDTEARRRYIAEGAAPTWKAPKLGSVRLDPKDAKPYVDDPVAFASWVAERHPEEVTATITLPADELAAALEALDFASIKPTTSEVTVREAFTPKLLAELTVTEEVDDVELGEGVTRTALRVVDEETGEVESVAGVKVLAPGATLVVTLDPAAKARSIAEADAVVDTEEADERAAEETDETDEPGSPDALAADTALVEAALAEPVDHAPPSHMHSDRLDEAVEGFLSGRVTLTAPDNLTATANPAGLGGGPADRIPYVEDPDPVTAALRSADIDREELDTLPLAGQPGYGVDAQDRRATLLTSIDLWEAQAARHREAQLADDPLILGGFPRDPHVDLGGRDPAPELSAEERAIVDRFETAPDALELDATEARLEAAIRLTGDEPNAELVTAAATAVEVARQLDEAFRTDDLKRIARRRKVSVAGTKAALAERLALAGVTMADATAIAREARTA